LITLVPAGTGQNYNIFLVYCWNSLMLDLLLICILLYLCIIYIDVLAVGLQ